MRRFLAPIQLRDIVWLLALVTIVWLLTRDAADALLVAVVYIAILLVIKFIRARIEHSLGPRDENESSGDG